MDYETISRRRQRLEKKRLRLVNYSGQSRPACACGADDLRCLHIDADLKRITCRNCRLRRRGLSDEARAKRRTVFAHRRYDAPRCIACGESDIAVLEEHHFCGRANGDLTGPFCANCHAIQSDMQNDLPRGLLAAGAQKRGLPYLAAFLFGVFILLAVLGANERNGEHPSLGTALLAISSAASAWAFWVVYADNFFVLRHGPDYDKGMSLTPPR